MDLPEGYRVVTPCYYDHIKKIYQTVPYSLQSRNHSQVGFYVQSATQFQQCAQFPGATSGAESDKD